MGKGGIVFYFWGADATEKGSLGPNTVVNSNQKILESRHTGRWLEGKTYPVAVVAWRRALAVCVVT